MTRRLGLNPLPKSWWAIYTESLLNSRGRQTEFQEWLKMVEHHNQLLRQLERDCFERTSFLRGGVSATHYSRERVGGA